MTKVIITGGSGLLGTNLTKKLEKKGYEVVWLSRNPHACSQKSFFWNPSKGEIDRECLKGVDAIINLAGTGVADKRWTPAYMKEISESRIQSTRLLHKTLKEVPNQVKTFLNASAVGIYGNKPKANIEEDGPMGDTFLAEVCKDWEHEAMHVKELGIRTAIVRIGIVLSQQGGFVKEIAKLTKWGLAAPLGNGNMQTPWIHIDDLSEIFIHLLEEKQYSGVYNGVSPKAESNRKLCQLISSAMHRPMFLPAVPAFILSVLVGKITPMLLADQNVSAEKILRSGFVFAFPDADSAIHNLFDPSN